MRGGDLDRSQRRRARRGGPRPEHARLRPPVRSETGRRAIEPSARGKANRRGVLAGGPVARLREPGRGARAGRSRRGGRRARDRGRRGRARRSGQRNWGAYILGQVASQLVRLGRLDEAEELAATGLEYSHRRDRHGDRSRALRRRSSLLRGDLGAALEAELERAAEPAGATTDVDDPRDAHRPAGAAGRAQRRSRPGGGARRRGDRDDGRTASTSSTRPACTRWRFAPTPTGRSAPELWATPKRRRTRSGRAPRSSSGSSDFWSRTGGWAHRRPSRSRAPRCRRRARAPQGARSTPETVERRRRPLGRARLQARARLRPLATGRGRARRRGHEGRGRPSRCGRPPG